MTHTLTTLTPIILTLIYLVYSTITHKKTRPHREEPQTRTFAFERTSLIYTLATATTLAIITPHHTRIIITTIAGLIMWFILVTLVGDKVHLSNLTIVSTAIALATNTPTLVTLALALPLAVAYYLYIIKKTTNTSLKNIIQDLTYQTGIYDNNVLNPHIETPTPEHEEKTVGFLSTPLIPTYILGTLTTLILSLT